ncbi:MAG: nucleoside hydrolase [Hyphobacterium sp.]|nr:MAG: nucleoside hydrolase [Hyphobacterium sp.]
MPRPIIIDCDPGIDDCIALMAALASPDEIRLEAICTVAGNVRVEICTANALGLLALTGHDTVPVYEGCDRPLTEAPVFADHIHGESGLGRVRFPDHGRSARSENAVDYLIHRLRDTEKPPVTLVVIGPSTNLATALVQAPDIAGRIDEIILMGGARREGGNITASAEFNIYADPRAAQTVLQCGRPVAVIGLDATLQLRCTPARMQRLRNLGSVVTNTAADMVDHVNAIYGEVYGAEGAALHDPCTIAYLLAPRLFQAQDATIEVETVSALTRGHTAVDIHRLGGKPANAKWIDGLQSDQVFDLLLQRLARL